jgi:acyl carrier protein
MEYISEIRNYIVDNFLFGADEGLQEDTSFLENGILDSTGIMELVAFVEKTYAIKVEDEELLPENFDTILAIAEYLKRKRNGTK